MAETYNLDMDEKKDRTTTAKAPSRPKATKHRNWTWFDDDQQKRFLRVQKKKGLDGSALLSMMFNEWADDRGL